MRKLVLISLLSLFSLLHVPYSGWAAKTTQPANALSKERLDKKKWQELTEGVDYRDDVKEEQKQRHTKKVNDNNVRTSVNFPDWLNNPILKIAVIVGLALLLIFFIARVIIQYYNPKVEPLNEAGLLEEIEANLLESDVDRFIKQAIADKNFRLATRLYYMKTIKELSLKELVSWKKDKTNFDYIVELRNWSYQDNFKAVTAKYERIWYGEVDVNAIDFGLLQNSFIDLLSKIN